MKINIFNNYIFNFAILSIILFIILPTESQINSFTFEEIQTENTNLPHVFDIVNYDDNTIVVHIIRENSSVPIKDNKICLDKYLLLRTIFPDGTLVIVNILLDIQDINFCILNEFNPVKIYAFRSNFLLVTYTVAD